MSKDLMSRLKKNSVIEHANSLADSTFFYNKKNTITEVPIFNLACSSHLNKGFGAGLTMIAGPSKHFKSNFGLMFVKSYLNANPDGICLYYDSEFGCTPEYLKSAGIDPERVLHLPIKDIEELKFDIVKQLQDIKSEENVIIFVDSVGNLASKKEVEDAMNEKSVADMTRAKQLKSLWRMATPYLTIKDIPCIVINHVYSEIGMFPKDIMGGGQGNMLAANTVFFISKAQEKENDEIAGYKFTLIAEKSRFVREKSKFPIVVTYEKGINRWSGLLDIAQTTGHVTKPKVGWYTRPSVPDDKNWRAKDTNSATFWKPIFENTDFKEACHNLYAIGEVELVSGDEDVTNINLNELVED